MVGTVVEVGVEYVRGREKRVAAGEELRPFAPPVFPFEPFGRNPDAGAEATSPFSARSISSRHTATLRCAWISGMVGQVPARSALAPTTNTISSSGMFFRNSARGCICVSCACRAARRHSV